VKLDIDSIMVPPPRPGETLDFARMFGNDRPVEMELGCGKGGFILERARAMAECNFFAAEWANKYCRFAADRMARWGIANVRLMRADGGHLVGHHLPDACLVAMHVYHPDPWPKKRHHKRRVFQPPFVGAVVRVLRSGGRLYVQTDHQEYFTWITDRLAAEPGLIVESAGLLDPDSPDGSPRTNYEIKYLREGRSIWSLVALRP
jgi:tRNA (guanine-N7-)-methyltransferase